MRRGAPALEKLLGSFLDDVRAALGDGTLQAGEDAAAMTDAQEARLLAELAAKRDSLAARLARFKQVTLPLLGAVPCMCKP